MHRIVGVNGLVNDSRSRDVNSHALWICAYHACDKIAGSTESWPQSMKYYVLMNCNKNKIILNSGPNGTSKIRVY
jgi:hypothetical protein